jgi:hypothetical protein
MVCINVVHQPYQLKYLFVHMFRFISIISVCRSNEPGWLHGELNGKTGLIPENYIQYCSNDIVHQTNTK